MDLKSRIDSVKTTIPKGVELIAVTKTVDAQTINEAITLGITDIAESRVGEAEDKFPKLLPCKKHLIGHLQTNKVKRAIELFDSIQSVDSIKLAEEINKRAYDKGKIMNVFIEVNIGGEDQKHGIMSSALFEFYNKLTKMQNIKVIGIMCIPPSLEAQKCRPYFKKMKELQKSINVKYCSMGMSNDYKVAIEEGSNMVRIGRAIFPSSRSV